MKGSILIPQATVEKPFEELDALCEFYRQLMRRKVRQRVKNGITHFKKFLAAHGEKIGYPFPSPFHLKTHLRRDIFLAYKEYLLCLVDAKRLSIITCYSYHKDLKNMVEFACDNRLTPDTDFIDVSIPYPQGFCKAVESYSDEEINSILHAVNTEINTNNRFIGQPYTRRRIGQDPALRVGTNDPKWVKYGWKNFDNAVWYFENRMNCDATQESLKRHPNFVTYLQRFGGVECFFSAIGVTRYITISNVGPLVLKLAYLTGLNPTSLFELNLDCLIENDAITNCPSLMFTKNRSGGAKKYPMSILDDDPAIQDLKQKNYLQIKKVIEQTKEVTRLVRDEVHESLSNLLFIFNSKSGKMFGRHLAVKSSNFSKYCAWLVGKYQLKDSSGKVLRLNVKRFRPTKISRMSKEGRSEFEIQALAGHQELRTTIAYKRLRNLEPLLEKETKSSLNHVYENIRWAKKISPQELKDGEIKTEKHVYKGIICDCKNVYDPPPEVKKTENYKEGQACTYYNMCLMCPNVVITKMHLPVLFNYRDEILASDSFNSGDIPLQHVYKRSLAMLDSILNEQYSEFSGEELLSAKRVAELDRKKYLDPLLHQPTTI